MKKTRVTVLTLTSLICLLAGQSAFAGQPVDPSTLNPPPPPEYNPVCEKDGSQTICTLQFSDPPFAGGTGVICGSGVSAYEVLQYQNRSVLGHRYYDKNGNLTRRHYREVFDGTLVNPLSHVALSYSGGDTHLHRLTTPGDIDSGTDAITGAVKIFLRDGGTFPWDIGRIVDSNQGILAESGQHPFLDYFVFGDTTALQPLCEALQ